MSTKVYRYRVKSLNGLLNKQARAVSYVWNFCNDTQKFALKWHKRWPSGFDLNKLTTGSSKELGLHAGTINAVSTAFGICFNQRSSHPGIPVLLNKATQLKRVAKVTAAMPKIINNISPRIFLRSFRQSAH